MAPHLSSRISFSLNSTPQVKNQTETGAAVLCGGRTLQEHLMSLLTIVIHLKRKGCMLTSDIQTLLKITKVRRMSDIVLKVCSVAPNVWIASSQ